MLTSAWNSRGERCCLETGAATAFLAIPRVRAPHSCPIIEEAQRVIDAIFLVVAKEHVVHILLPFVVDFVFACGLSTCFSGEYDALGGLFVSACS
jgi:hypothetical protein